MGNEEWNVIKEFPTYRVSSFGRVVNSATGRILKESVTNAGVVKIGLVSGGKQHSRSVKVLVAENFVEKENKKFDTPVHLDGNQLNNFASNLAWRPRWFACRYARQFNNLIPDYNEGPIKDIEDSVVYRDVYSAAVLNGLLFNDILESTQSDKGVFPSWHHFSFN